MLWTQVSDIDALRRRLHGACAFNNELWISGGIGFGLVYLDDVWHSHDGVNWIRESVGNQTFSPREGHAMIEHDDALWVLGGFDSANYLNDVWVSVDGRRWERTATGASSFTTRDDHAAFSFDGKIWVVGGDRSAAGIYLNDIWSSPDGVNWTQEPSDIGLNRTLGGYAVFNNRMYMACGRDAGGGIGSAAHSSNGPIWQTDPTTAGLPVVYSCTSEVFDNKLAVSGGVIGQVASSDLYWTGDGLRWKRSPMGIARYDHRMVALKSPNRLFLLQGHDAAGAYMGDTWMTYGFTDPK